MNDNLNNNSSKIFIIGATLMLLISIGINGTLFAKLKEANTRIEWQSIYLNDADKERMDVYTTLGECNAALATVQAKPAPVPFACPPVQPMPACPSVPTVVCPAAPEPSPVVAPAPIATPVPKIIYKYKYIHRHIHYRKRAVTPAEPICDTEYNGGN